MIVKYKLWGALAAIALTTAGLASIASAQAPPAAPPPPREPLGNFQQQQPQRPPKQAAQPEPATESGQAAQPGAIRIRANKPVMTEYRDQSVADWLIICNQAEVQEAQMALQHTERASVREFAQMLQRDHDHAVQQLVRFASRPIGQPGQAARLAQAAGADGEVRMSKDLPFLVITREISDETLTGTRREMEQKKGIDFDRAFVGSQIEGHLRLIATMKVLNRYASAELRQMIEKEIQVAAGHLDRAKALEKELVQ